MVYSIYVTSKDSEGLNFVYLTDTNTMYHYGKDDVINNMNCGDLYVKELSATDLVGFKIDGKSMEQRSGLPDTLWTCGDGQYSL